LPVRAQVSSAGNWCIDAVGRPCEVARFLTPNGPRWALSYVGWRLADLEGAPQLAHTARVDEQIVYVLTPDAVPNPRRP